jgi:cell division protein FtsB
MTTARAVGAAVALGGIVFALIGGEYGTLDWWQLRRSIETEQGEVERLKAENDSLTSWAEALESDSATQEKVARESFGMLRPGEILYRVERRTP